MHQQQPARLINDQTAFTKSLILSPLRSCIATHLQCDVVAPDTRPAHLRTVVHEFIISKTFVQLRSSLQLPHCHLPDLHVQVWCAEKLVT